jgi:amidohydrolase
VQEILTAAQKLKSNLSQWRRWCHQHPGIGYDVEETAEYIVEILSSLGIKTETQVGRSGVVGIIEGKEPGPVIALRADMDALPIQEENNHEYKSLYPGKMHACGHDAHVAMLLGAAHILKEGNFAGTVILMFQPAEEGLGGAKAMINDGVMSRHQVQAIFGGHIGLISNELSTGQVGVSYRPMMAATYSFEARITGKGGHGAMPHQAVDPIVIAAEVITAWQRLISREISPVHPAVLTIASIHGGSAHNIIPEHVDMKGTIRYLNPEAGDTLLTRMEQVLTGICEVWRAKGTITIGDGYPPVVNDRDFTAFFAQVAEEIVGRENVIDLEYPTMGGEDMAFFLQEAPGTFFFLGGGNPEKGITYPHHHPKFEIDEEVLPIGTALLAAGALKYLQKNKKILKRCNETGSNCV